MEGKKRFIVLHSFSSIHTAYGDSPLRGRLSSVASNQNISLVIGACFVATPLLLYARLSLVLIERV